VEAVTFDSEGEISYNVKTGELSIPVIDDSGKKFNLKLKKPSADFLYSLGVLRLTNERSQ
jgi:hypothetical protein